MLCTNFGIQRDVLALALEWSQFKLSAKIQPFFVNRSHGNFKQEIVKSTPHLFDLLIGYIDERTVHELHTVFSKLISCHNIKGSVPVGENPDEDSEVGELEDDEERDMRGSVAQVEGHLQSCLLLLSPASSPRRQ